MLVLEEHWCGDAARTGPVLARLAEACERIFPAGVVDELLACVTEAVEARG